MANEIDALLARVDDPALRRDLKTQFDRLRQKRQFGLVFEEHLPERVMLPQHPIRRGTKVVPRNDPDAEPRIVVAVNSGVAMVPTDDGTTEDVPTDSLVAIAEFGEPIYPGLRRLGSVDRGGDKPAHVVIKGENYHALEALRFTHAGKIDCIYIDPPYNTGARDWKYNNDFVDGDDAYRHSKWLAMMQRRLRLARDLLNPSESVLIVTIDEKEYLRLGLLLEQEFSDCGIQMVSVRINPSGVARLGEFRRSDEYAYFVRLGDQGLTPSVLGPEWSGASSRTKKRQLEWNKLRRTGTNTQRSDRPNLFYPLFVDPGRGRIDGVGEPLPPGDARTSVTAQDGIDIVWPIRQDGSEGNWQIGPDALRAAIAEGFVRLGGKNARGYAVYYLKSGEQRRLREGVFRVTGQRPDGSVLAELSEDVAEVTLPTTQWVNPAHDAATHGSRMLRSLIPSRTFPFPKSLYAVEDMLRFVVGSKPDATVLDFFAGSGTTAHATARLNRQDGGRRLSISVTNNEVSAEDSKRMSAVELTPGDPEWEALGIFENIARPRIEAAVTGMTSDGDAVKGDYRFIDEFPMAEGLEENVEFVELTYLDAEDIELDMAFTGIAPLLWMRAGSRGPLIEERTDADGAPVPYASTEVYAVLFDPDQWRPFLEELPGTVTTVFVVTDSASVFAGVAGELPEALDVVRLYENYLTTFAINRGGNR